MLVTLSSRHGALEMTESAWHRTKDCALVYGWKPERSRYEDLVDSDGNVEDEYFVVDKVDAETLADTLQRILDNLPEDKSDDKSPPKGWPVDDPIWHQPCESCGNLCPVWPTWRNSSYLREVIRLARKGEFSVW